MKRLGQQDSFKTLLWAWLGINGFVILLALVSSVTGWQMSLAWGLRPRSLDWALIGQWLISPWLHGSWQHWTSNAPLFALISAFWLLAFGLRRMLLYTIGLMCLTNVFVYVFGAPNSAHVGLSGFIFASFGFWIYGLVAKNESMNKLWLFVGLLLLLAWVGTSWIYLGLLPREGVSWTAHAGGFISGWLPVIYEYRRKK